MDNKINGFLYAMVYKGVYGLVHSGIIAHTVSKEHPPPFGCEPAPITPGLWSHKNNVITFTLVVDAFEVRYQRKDNALHLTHALQVKYEITQYWTGSL